MTSTVATAGPATAAGSHARWAATAMIVGLAMSYGVLMRAVVTELGEGSFGRVWPYYLNYFDFGFIRRGLFGTVIYPLQSLVREFGLYPTSYTLAAVLIALTAAVTLIFLRSLRANGWTAPALYLPLFLSPAFLMHFAYSTGNTDIVLGMLFLLGMLARRHTLLLALICAVAVLVHEIFVLAFLPALLGAGYIDDPDRRQWWRLPGPVVAAAGVSLALFLVVNAFGLWTGTEAAFKQTMAGISPELLRRSGWFEITSDLRAVLDYTWPQLLVPINWAFMALPTLYVVFAAAVFFPRDADGWRKLVFLGAAFGPLVLIAFGTDAYRWISFAGAGTVAMGLTIGGRGGHRSLMFERPRLGLALLLPWALVGPIGSACCSRPFPALQFLIEKLV